MHAYLIAGGNIEDRKEEAGKLSGKLKAKIWEFPLTKIDDVRNLNSFTSLKVTAPTAVYIDSIEGATNEALNAFLKNLEEPQENLYYILSTSFLAEIMPTIVSRCEIIKLPPEPISTDDKTVKLPTLDSVDKIKDRGEAINFVGDFIGKMHFNLLNSDKGRKAVAENLETAVTALNNLKANGNVNLQLSNMVINLK